MSQASMPQVRYNGIFSSSLCGMFEGGPQSKTDACALACCGVWLWERNQYMLEQKTPKPWRQRPIEVGIFLLIISVAIAWTIDPESIYLQVAVILIISGILWRMLEFQHTRAFFRIKLAIDKYTRDHSGEQNLNLQDPGLHMFLAQNRKDIHGVHALCGCSRVDHIPLEEEDETRDFCRRLWRFLASLCCGACCMCWCQWCGICATAQEHRHLRKVLPDTQLPYLLQRDYITMQPWGEYFKEIVQLRDRREMRFIPHVKALSLLSSRLLKAFALFLLAATLVTALPVHYSRWQLLVLFGTFLQPIVFLYFVHWFWNRLDLSLDALIKFFASGFFICTSVVIVYELLVSMAAAIAVAISGLVGSSILVITGEATIEKTDDDINGEEAELNIPMPYKLALGLFGAFLNAFVVAGLVEELGKYLCFWMCEHPDLVDKEVVMETNPTIENANAREDMELLPPDETSQSLTPPVSASLVSRGSAITIAMVATSLGFACAENLLYVFVYTPPGIDAELSTLIVRCMFPVHPLAAALQSIGVCRRDLEGDKSTQVGRILYPAWFLHGVFDFVLMAYAVLEEILNGDSDDESTNNTADQEKGEESTDAIEELKSAWIILVVAFTIPLVGLVYYFKEAWAQRRRLRDLESRSDTINRSGAQRN